MIILDTNVISELMRPSPEPRVEQWLGAQNGSEIYLSTVSEAELRYGAAILVPGRRRDQLTTLLDAILIEDFRGRILPFDSAAASAFAEIAARRRSLGRPITQFDCQIAATAFVHSAELATRNVRDFEDCGIGLIDPWQT